MSPISPAQRGPGGPVTGDQPVAETGSVTSATGGLALAERPVVIEPRTPLPAAPTVRPAGPDRGRALLAGIAGIWARMPARVRSYQEWPVTLVLVGVCFSLAVVGSEHFRRGTVLLSLTVLLACALRVLLPSRSAGLLAVRSKLADVATLGSLAMVLFTLCAVIPAPN